MSGLDLETAPASEPVTLQEAKNHLRFQEDDENDLIEAYIAAARSTAEAFLKMSLLTTAWKYRIDWCFPKEIRLPIGPVLDTDNLSISYVDDQGEDQTLDASEYQVSTGETGVIRPAYGKVWPSTQPVLDAVTVDFEAGWDSADNIPKAILQALKLTISDYFEQRENMVVGQSVAEIPNAARNLMVPFVRHD